MSNSASTTSASAARTTVAIDPAPGTLVAGAHDVRTAETGDFVFKPGQMSYSNVAKQNIWKTPGNNNYNKNKDLNYSAKAPNQINKPARPVKQQSNVPKRNGSKSGNKRRTQNVIIGSGNSTALARAPRRFHYCIGRLRPDCDSDKLREHIDSFLGDGADTEVQEIQLKHNSSYRLFKVSVSDKFANEMNDVQN